MRAQPAPSALKALRGRLLWFAADPQEAGERACRYVEDGALIVERGLVRSAGEAGALLGSLPPGTPIEDHRPHLILPGFIDPHIHFPQTQVIASYGAQLLDWLNKYTFVEEQRFADPAHCERVTPFLLRRAVAQRDHDRGRVLLGASAIGRCFFAESERRDMLMVAAR